jgi:aspartyl-tRNA(Asn)/glutamyl-tRNA(Gln) amidotransferase subunit C
VAVTEDDVRHVARLARLGIDPARVDLLVRELNGILTHMEVLRAVPADAATPGDPRGPSLPLRPDEGPPLSLAIPLPSFAPEPRDGFLLVPRLATHEQGKDDGESPP